MAVATGAIPGTFAWGIPRRLARDRLTWTVLECREQAAPALLAGLMAGCRSRSRQGLGLGPRVGSRVALQFRMIVHAGPRTDHAADPGSGPDRAQVRALRFGSERADREQRDQP